MEKKQAPLDAPKVIRIGRVQLTLNVFVQAVVVLAIVAMANYLSIRHYRRFDLSQNQKFALSPQTKAIVGGLAKPLQAIVFFAGAAESVVAAPASLPPIRICTSHRRFTRDSTA